MPRKRLETTFHDKKVERPRDFLRCGNDYLDCDASVQRSGMICIFVLVLFIVGRVIDHP